MKLITKFSLRSPGNSKQREILLKWFWLSGYDAPVDVFLLHDYNRKTCEERLLPRFENVEQCEWCKKFGEEQIRETGFDTRRLLPMPQDILSNCNDFGIEIVSERFRETCECHNIQGVDFVPCGRSRKRGNLYVLWAQHHSHCSRPPEDWRTPEQIELANSESSKRVLTWLEEKVEPCRLPYTACPNCGRPDHVIGFPKRSFLTLPDDLTISIPSIRTEMRSGIDFRFFFSDRVRKIFKEAKLKGCCFSDMDKLNPPFEA